jgi:hypothetical protein
LTIEIAKLVAATLARFAKAEKPQLSPRLGASFTKKRRQISGIRLNARTASLHQFNPRQSPDLRLSLVLLGF